MEMKLAVVVMTMLAVAGICSAATLTVGDRTGWSIPSGSSFYSDWAKKQNFKVGDVLVFNFPAGAHTVAQVSRSAYSSCSGSNPISAVKTTAPANYTLSSGGTHYFICTIANHCSSGQKLAVTVAGDAPSPQPSSPGPTAGEPVPSTSPTSSFGPSASGPSTGGTTPPPGGNFAAPTAAGVSLLSLLALAVAALF